MHPAVVPVSGHRVLAAQAGFLDRNFQRRHQFLFPTNQRQIEAVDGVDVVENRLGGLILQLTA